MTQTLLNAHTKYMYARGEKRSWSENILVIWGENDPLRTERSQKGMVDIYPQAQIHVIPGTGHTAAISEPVKYS
jgi:pimeloyl-ACP methyl ester carboxylesterase